MALGFDPHADNNVNLRTFHVKEELLSDCMLLVVPDLGSQFQM